MFRDQLAELVRSKIKSLGYSVNDLEEVKCRSHFFEDIACLSVIFKKESETLDLHVYRNVLEQCKREKEECCLEHLNETIDETKVYTYTLKDIGERNLADI